MIIYRLLLKMQSPYPRQGHSVVCLRMEDSEIGKKETQSLIVKHMAYDFNIEASLVKPNSLLTARPEDVHSRVSLHSQIS